jgi:hypothetical protein
MVEHNGDAMVFIEREAELDGFPEEDTGPKLLFIGIVGFQLAVVNGQSGAQIEKPSIAELEFPHDPSVDFAGIAATVDA